MGKFFIIAGALLLVAGVVVTLLERSGIHLGQLPGDQRFSRGNWTFALPTVTCIVASVVLTVVLNLLSRIGK